MHPRLTVGRTTALILNKLERSGSPSIQLCLPLTTCQGLPGTSVAELPGTRSLERSPRWPPEEQPRGQKCPQTCCSAGAPGASIERLEHLELAAWCSGPVLAALARFKRLRTLIISGNGAEIDWQGRGAAAVSSKLRQLRLDCRGPNCPHAYEESDGELYDFDFPECTLSKSIAKSMLTASRLHSLALVLDWTEDVAALCLGLPALRSLRWVGGRAGGRAGKRVGRQERV